MISSNKIRYLNSLQLKKIRQKHGYFIAEGDKIVEDLLLSDWNINEIFGTQEWIKKLSEKQKKQSVIHEVITNDLKKVSTLKTPHNVLAVVKIPEKQKEFKPAKNQLYLALDDIQDPGNLGTIIRIASWFGIRDIICSHNSADVFNPKVVQSSMSAFIYVQVHYMDLKKTLKQFKQEDLPVYGTFPQGKSIYKKNLKSCGVVLMGNESKGISKELYPFITQKLSIPTFFDRGEGVAESLNIASATAVICSEFRRRKRRKDH